jgi:predicted membrane protein
MERNKHLETILVLVIALIVVFIFNGHKYWLWGALALAAIGVFIPYLAGKIHWAWMKLAHAMGYVMSKVMLTLVYVLVVVPMGIFSRKKITMQLKQLKQSNNASYFRERNYTYKKEDLENVW